MNKSFRNGLIVCGIVSLFAIGFHGIYVKPHDWNSLFMWIPVTWVIPLSASAVEYFSNKRK